MPKKPSKDYINGFKHGVKWAGVYMYTQRLLNLHELYQSSKIAVKSLKEGR